MTSHKIKVVVGANIKREAVLINPNIGAGEPVISSAADAKKEEASNVIATGASSIEILSKIYGR